MEAKDLVNKLIDKAKMKPEQISEALEGRVSRRTLYRWAKGESAPQNSTDLKALQELVAEKCG